MARNRLPPHPGDYIQREILDRLNLSNREAGKAAGVSHQAISSIVRRGRRSRITPEMALRLELAFGHLCGVRMEVLVQQQTAYDIAAARARESEIRIQPYVPKKESEVKKEREVQRRLL